MSIELSQQAEERLGQRDLVILTERVDDVALLIGQMVKMGLVEVLDRHLVWLNKSAVTSPLKLLRLGVYWAAQSRHGLPPEERLFLQRYLIECLAQTPFSMREIGTVIALLQVSHQPQDVIRIENFERQHHFQ